MNDSGPMHCSIVVSVLKHCCDVRERERTNSDLLKKSSIDKPMFSVMSLGFKKYSSLCVYIIFSTKGTSYVVEFNIEKKVCVVIRKIIYYTRGI